MSINKDQRFPEGWKTSEMRLITTPLIALRQFPGLSTGKGRRPQLRGRGQNQGSWSSQDGMQKRILHPERSPKTCKGFPLGIQLSTIKCVYVKKLSKARKRTTQKIRGTRALFSPATPKSLKLQGTSVEYNKVFLP